MKQLHTSSTASIVALTGFVVLFVFFLYAFLHEAGHAIVGVVLGQTLAEFNVNFWDLSAHVDLAGGTLSQAQLAVRSAAGVLLPLLVWAIFIGVVPRKANFLLEALKLVASMAVINTLLAWIILPIAFLAGKTPADDVTNFLRYSRMPSLLLSLIALVLYMSGWNLFLSKIDGWKQELLLFRTVTREQLIESAGHMLPRLAVLLAVCLLAVFAIDNFARGDRFAPPEGFRSVAKIDLSKQTYSGEALAEFTLAKPSTIGIFVVVRHIRTPYFDLRVTGPEGFRSIVLHGEGYSADQDGGLWQQDLPPGTYQIVLTSDQSDGSASIYSDIQ